MYIKDDRLREMLQRNREYIGNKRSGTDSLFAIGTFFLSLFFYDYDKFKEKWFAPVLYVLIAAACICSLKMLSTYIMARLHPYDADDLYTDLMNASDKANDFSLLIIKQNGKYLLIHDKRWKCWLFPYIPSHDDRNVEAVAGYAQSLGIDVAGVEYECQDCFTKYSVSDKVMKDYRHKYYSVIANSTKGVNNNKLKWFSVEEMKLDKATADRNMETIEFVSRHF